MWHSFLLNSTTSFNFVMCLLGRIQSCTELNLIHLKNRSHFHLTIWSNNWFVHTYTTNSFLLLKLQFCVYLYHLQNSQNSKHKHSAFRLLSRLEVNTKIVLTAKAGLGLRLKVFVPVMATLKTLFCRWSIPNVIDRQNALVFRSFNQSKVSTASCLWWI